MAGGAPVPAPFAPRGPLAGNLARRSTLAALLLRDRAEERPGSVLLFAETSGEPFGPPLGRMAGRDRTVVVIVSLPLVEGS